MRRYAVATGAVAVAVALAWPAAAAASCIRQTPAQQRAAAHVIFVGVALEGPTASGVQRFRVERYEKGGAAEERRVATGVVARPDGTGSTTSVSVEAAAGERWRIYGTEGAGGVIDTNICAGAARLASAPTAGTSSDSAPPPAGSVQTSGGEAAARLPLALAAVFGVLMIAGGLTMLRLRARPHAGR